MVRAYAKLAVRHFRRNHVTSAINLLGLTIGLATCLVAGLYIKHELLVIATRISIGSQTLNAAMQNPAETLKEE